MAGKKRKSSKNGEKKWERVENSWLNGYLSTRLIKRNE